ncbi:hypothetical protein BGX38DRAFT_1146771 [Terfezia claveryi]|nr:hypothetical protein BGX38DRAFT_1146771 [Terfezia claveryi]
MRDRKRTASQAIALPVTTKRSVPVLVQLRNEISFDDRIDDFDEESDRSSSESDEEIETSIPTSVLAPDIGKKTRSFASILGIHQGITNTIRKIVEYYTLYKKPLLTPGEIQLLTQNVWLKSIHMRTRAHLVAECRSHIMKIYGINYLSKDAMKEKVEYLLDRDRFICRRAKREKYFEGRKRKGNREPDFLEKINGVFICLVATAIRLNMPEMMKRVVIMRMKRILKRTKWVGTQAGFNFVVCKLGKQEGVEAEIVEKKG